MIDRTTCWPVAVPLSSISTEACVNAFISAWIPRFGVPATLTSDRGAQFTSSVWPQFAILWGSQPLKQLVFIHSQMVWLNIFIDPLNLLSGPELLTLRLGFTSASGSTWTPFCSKGGYRFLCIWSSLWLRLDDSWRVPRCPWASKFSVHQQDKESDSWLLYSSATTRPTSASNWTSSCSQDCKVCLRTRGCKQAATCTPVPWSLFFMQYINILSRLKSPINRFQLSAGLIKSWNIEYDFKWDNPYLSSGSNFNRCSNSLNLATLFIIKR